MKRSPNKKQSAYQLGLWAETLAALLLKAKGYRIIDRRHRNYAGEVDIIAARFRSLVFVEVKARKTGGMEEVLSPTQQRRIVKAAELFLSQHPRFEGYDIRFDVIWVQPWRFPLHIKNGWGG